MNEDMVFKRFFIISRLHFHIVHDELEKHDIHPGQPPLLMLVAKNEGITQNLIARKLNVSPATVAIMLRRMEKSGLIQREQDESDRRFQRVYLTDKGSHMAEILKSKMEKVEKIAMDGFSSSEKDQFLKFLDRIIENLKKHTKEWCHD
ncbi:MULTISPECIES: MarR family winged helix-turn-helix transcriptional regulator [Pseudothermotoga]|jgi:DNA-binding MarR family transcriptional regulator|uniref:Transcriptional regulator, MarR family n=2 Tax=Pseudothermotoga TaxID=1643951 RepID=A8F7N0_PSELT|nr:MULTISPECIES: MarR family transcriptional regulator [Pseudothermotoga]ABV34164.1 transcriptional regulator, MarR family [Pseudothermotoga lettingae TMO]MDI3495171.1 hypothetical protein [Pseudothermotoga sp.]MDK2884770.1 hypothetical protein [Pseudothermotoga sp.]GLI48892.1 MarR family transcriptional regulator [Pseudothermotoga lettingae TMO]HBJ81208.1 MarR family transcriptional regulator [Pseudothermotoga sp.]